MCRKSLNSRTRAGFIRMCWDRVGEPYRLNWIIMFRPVKPSAMFHVGDFDKLPKPMAIKAKADPQTGLVKLQGEKDFQQSLKDAASMRAMRKSRGLKLTAEGSLVNNKGQRFFSDMDLYEVLDGGNGPVRLGSAPQPRKGLELSTGYPD